MFARDHRAPLNSRNRIVPFFSHSASPDCRYKDVPPCLSRSIEARHTICSKVHPPPAQSFPLVFDNCNSSMPPKKSAAIESYCPKPRSSTTRSSLTASPAVPVTPTHEAKPPDLPDDVQESPRPNARRISSGKTASLETVKAGISAIYQKTGQEARNEIWELLWHLSLHEPALNKGEWHESVNSRWDEERAIEDRDPHTMKEVFERICKELDETFEKLEPDRLYQRFFATDYQKTERQLRSLAAIESKWLERWLIKNRKQSKTVIGFIGEYVVTL